MTTNRRHIEMQLVKVQDEFLNNPSASLSAEQAQNRSGVDAVTCQAILDVLREAGVIAQSPTGAYARYFPPLGRRFRGDAMTLPPLRVLPPINNRSAA
ncbi:MAG TPA: hypothetical protein VFJ02_10450 [Vicinamibacterales bacterium]|nr:hypothetical protein [Vicinamibacterales bacterium]